MTEFEKILKEEGITSYEVIEDRQERNIRRVTVKLPNGRTVQVNTSTAPKKTLPDYDVIEERHENGCKYVTLRCLDGRTAHLCIPDHTEEEKAKIASNFTRAAFKMVFPNDDWSHTNLKIII